MCKVRRQTDEESIVGHFGDNIVGTNWYQEENNKCLLASEILLLEKFSFRWYIVNCFIAVA